MKTYRAFSLIEAAIVLALIGLVIGGIWIAAARITRESRISETVEGILYTVQKAKRLLPVYTYPSTNGTGINVTSTLFYAGSTPPGWKFSSPYLLSPLGAQISIAQSCYSICPMLSISVYGPGSSPRLNVVSANECTTLVRKIANLAVRQSDFYYMQFHSPTLPTAYSFPPINPSTLVCPSDFNYVVLWFNPMP